MRNLIKLMLLSLLVVIFSVIFCGCSDNNPLDKVKSMFSSSAEQSGPSDSEVLGATACHGEGECSCRVVQRDKQTDDGSYPVRVRMTCSDGTSGENIYKCKKVQDAWRCS